MNKITKTKLQGLLGIRLTNDEDKAIFEILTNNVSLDDLCKSLSSISDGEAADFITGLKNAISVAKGEISNPIVPMLLIPPEEERENMYSAKDLIDNYVERNKIIYHVTGTQPSQGTVVILNKDKP